MSVRMVKVRACDLDGAEPAEARRFIDHATGRAAMTVDLCAACSGKLDKLTAQMAEHAQQPRQRGAGTQPQQQPPAVPVVPFSNGNGNGHSEPTREDIRAWAKSKDLPVADFGRISADVIERYNRAHGLPEPVTA